MPPNRKRKRLNFFLRRYLLNKTSSSESAFVETYYDSFDTRDNPSLSEKEYEETGERILENIRVRAGEPSDAVVVPLYRKRILRLAAALIAGILVGAGIYFFMQKPEKAPPLAGTITPKLHDAEPGGNRAILTLSDGSTVVLDNAANGTISNQGGTEVVKLSNGEIMYQPVNSNRSGILFNTMSTPRGGLYQLVLPDGSKVWLNAASSITYPTAFTGSERRVRMTGEAYFEVAKNTKQPFYVSIGNQTEIKVLGTHFNINTYADEGVSSATLLEGSVSVRKDNQTKLLIPGHQAEITGSITVRSDIDLDEVMAWKNGFFSFNKTDLQTVMKQLSRWYDVDVVYEGALPDMKFWGGISRNSTLSQVVKILEESKVKFRIEDKKIIVFSK